MKPTKPVSLEESSPRATRRLNPESLSGSVPDASTSNRMNHSVYSGLALIIAGLVFAVLAFTTVGASSPKYELLPEYTPESEILSPGVTDSSSNENILYREGEWYRVLPDGGTGSKRMIFLIIGGVLIVSGGGLVLSPGRRRSRKR